MTNVRNCDLKYMIEPSFFYGAMYVSYGLTVGICNCYFYNFLFARFKFSYKVLLQL